ncbi:MAG TPA: diacylglycerol kinase family protein [Casimicrobiaceae bacterium]|nr:diacylglycerol kinase family protein [Casimicrobiaceae bacterium]
MSGAPFYIVLNAGSGHSDTDTTCRAIAGILNAAGRAHEILRVEDPKKIDETARLAVDKARANGGIVVAAGGDGTLNAVAQATLGSGCQFGVIPQGTFNYFGRTHGISSETTEATRSLLTARVEKVQVGLVNDRVFLVNASLGLYPQLLEDREEQKERHGRSRLVAMWAALLTIFREYRPMRVKLEHAGRTHELQTLTLFVGNNRLQLEQLGLDEAESVEEGKLAAIILRPVPTLTLLWLAVQGALGNLAHARGVEHFASSSVMVTPSFQRIRRLKIATDGETEWMDTPIEFRIAREPLLLLTPIDAVPETAA